jgi:hypothetical protein
MSRDLVFATMALVLCGAVLSLTSWIPGRRAAAGRLDVSGRQLERQAWRRIWLPTLPAAIVLATLFGWAVQEPSLTDEPLRPLVVVVAVPLGLLWLRCGVRAWLSLRRPRVLPAVATLGLLRPTIVVSGRLNEVLDPEALAAAMAHEEAHVRHRDPLRIWLAQIATDMQWPSPAARSRFDGWLSSLEIARDEEARVEGAPGPALAAAVVAVAKMTMGGRHELSMATLTGTGASIASRIHRLLGPMPPYAHSPSMVVPIAVILALTIAIGAGVECGDSFLRALPFIAT